MATETKKTIPEASYETGVLTDRIGKMLPGELVTYDEFSKVCGRNVRTVAAGNLISARNRAINIHGIVCECVRGEGYRRLVGNELVAAQTVGMKRIHNESRRRINKLSKVEFDALDNDHKSKMNASLSIYGLLNHVTKSKSQTLIENKVKESSERLAIGRTMELFQGKK